VRALAALLVVLVVAGAARATTVTATIDPARMAVGESADLAVAVDGTQSAPRPEIANTAGLSISYVGPASQVSFVNGRMSSSITHHFTVVGTKAGRYVIGPITVDADGKRYDAGTVTVELVASGAGDAATGGDGDQVTLEMSLPRTEVYLRERLPLSVRLLVGAVRVTNPQFPLVPGDGFALEKFPQPAQRQEQTAHGTRQVVDFRTTLTPLKAGTLTVGPATMAMELVVQSRRRGGFFGGLFDDSRPLTVQSSPITLTVLPLPSEGRPADFTGAVGQFTLDVTAAPTDLAVGDPVTVRTTIHGDGSLDGVAGPAIVASDTLRVYPQQASQAPDTPGTRTFEQVVIPLRDGSVPLPALRWSYFDPQARAYRTATPAPIVLTVRPSANAKAAPEIVGGQPAAPVEPARPETLGRDIVFIKDAPGTLRPIGARTYRAPMWWIGLLVPLALWAAVAAWGRRRSRLHGDVRYARYTRAGQQARTALASARASLGRGDVSAAHDIVAGAVRDYLAAKLDRPPGTIAETAPVGLRSAGVDGTVATDVEAFFADCEAARFAPGGTGRSDLQRALTRADAIVRALERTRRLAPRALAAMAMVALAGHVLAAGGDGPSALFIRGNGLYGDGRYADAAAVYEQIRATGLESGPVEFNLGNAYLKAGDVGRAVLAYERARRLVPADPDLGANLAFARELARDVEEPPLLERLAFPLASRAPTDTLVVAAAACWWLVWLALAVGVLAPAAGAAARGVAIASALACVVVGSSAAYRWWTLERPTTAVVVAHADVTVRSEPTATATALFVATPGTVLTIERTREGAALVTSRDGRRGWVDSASLATL
jgi:tetratricopeptide (TPR) repeat protein